MSKEMGQVYLERFRAWADSMSDDDFRQIVYVPRGILNRQEIKEQSGLSDQAIKKNPNVKEELKALEDRLREREVLPPLTEAGVKAQAGPKLYDKDARKSSMDAQRAAHLESSNHDLKVRVAELEKEVKELRARLSTSQETVEAVTDGLAAFALCPTK